MTLLVIPLIHFATLAAGMTQFLPPTGPVTHYVGDQIQFTLTLDPTDANGNVVAEPCRMVTGIINVDTSVWTTQPTITTPVSGASVSVVKDPLGWKFFFSLPNDMLLKGDIAALTVQAPNTAGTYSFKVTDVGAANAAGAVVQVANVYAPDSLVLQNRPQPYQAALRIK